MKGEALTSHILIQSEQYILLIKQDKQMDICIKAYRVHKTITKM